jgi:hypothetical protein
VVNSQGPADPAQRDGTRAKSKHFKPSQAGHRAGLGLAEGVQNSYARAFKIPMPRRPALRRRGQQRVIDALRAVADKMAGLAKAADPARAERTAAAGVAIGT